MNTKKGEMVKMYKNGFKLHTVNLLTEIVDGALRENMGVLKVPLTVFQRYLFDIAQRASQLNDPILNEIMVNMALYEFAVPESKEYDRVLMDKIYADAANYRNKIKKQKQ